ncbi:MAG: hypothetical protein GX663_06255 [Clostridiales bacterium]|nr:hypothetical protein [Clostridiales bacterium]
MAIQGITTQEMSVEEIVMEETVAEEMPNNMIPVSEMTSFLQGVQMMQEAVRESPGDIPISELETLASDQGISAVASELGSPRIFPSSPQFAAPNNPLLPPQYSEILDYNSIQYMNGIFRTQIGRYVKVNQLIGSNTIAEHDGYLIGVGINYIILQDYNSDNITFIDFYGIKNMYTYYEEISNPYTVE